MISEAEAYFLTMVQMIRPDGAVFTPEQGWKIVWSVDQTSPHYVRREWPKTLEHMPSLVAAMCEERPHLWPTISGAFAALVEERPELAPAYEQAKAAAEAQL